MKLLDIKRHKSVLAVDVGSSAIKLAIVDPSGFRVKLRKAAIIENFVKEAVNNEFLKDRIKEFMNGNPEVKRVYIAISAPDLLVERIRIPVMPLKEISNAVNWKIKERINFPIEEAICDSYMSNEGEKKEESKNIAVSAAVVNKTYIYGILPVFQDLNLDVENIGAVPFNIANVIRAGKSAKADETTICAEIGASHTYVSVYRGYKLQFTRNVPVSSSQITDSMCGVLVSDKGTLELSKQEAENIKRKYGMPENTGAMLDNKISASQLNAMIRPVLEQVASEIKRTINYTVNELGFPAPEKILLTGGGARLKNIDLFLAKELNMKIEFLNLLDNIENDTDLDRISILSYLASIGAVLSSAGKKINLIPAEIATQRIEHIEKVTIRMVGVVLLSVLLVSYIGLSINIANLNKQLETAKSHGKALQKVISMYNRIGQYNQAISLINQQGISGELIMQEISNMIPANIVLDEISIKSESGEAQFFGVLFCRSSIVEDELTNFMELLENSKIFNEASLISVTKNEGKKGMAANFNIKCTLSGYSANTQENKTAQGYSLNEIPAVKILQENMGG